MYAVVFGMRTDASGEGGRGYVPFIGHQNLQITYDAISGMSPNFAALGGKCSSFGIAKHRT
jgi:hypothetical protein